MRWRVSFLRFGLSSIYESESIGFTGDNFLNLVVAVETELSLVLVQEFLKRLEESQGRDRTQAKIFIAPYRCRYTFLWRRQRCSAWHRSAARRNYSQCVRATASSRTPSYDTP